MPLQARTEFAAAINQIASEKGVDTDVVIDAIEQAALAAYRKDLSLRGEAIPDDFDSLTSKIDSSTGEISIHRGDENITPPGFARIAAQTAKQVILQKLHEAEKGAIMEEYDKKVGSVISGMIQRQEGNTYFIDLGRAEGVMPPSEQTRDEVYIPNQRMKFLIKEIRESGRGPEVVVSRADPELVKGLFAMEVPEIQSGAVEIREIAREAGGRTKLAAISTQEGVDPVGSLVGQKGVRVQAVTNELGEEKIDIISFSEDPARFIAAALSPAKDVIVELNEEEKVAKVKIPDNQLSLAIGKGGQNVRLAAKLTGWKIDIEGTGESLELGVKSEENGTQIKEEGTKERKEQKTEDSVIDNLASTQTSTQGTIDEEEAGTTQPESTPGEAAPADVEEDIKKEGKSEKGDGEKLKEEEKNKDNKDLSKEELVKVEEIKEGKEAAEGVLEAEKFFKGEKHKLEEQKKRRIK